jgi:hypothetical protein
LWNKEMTMKKTVAFFLAIMGIVFLLGTCSNILSPPKDRNVIPQGKGRLALSVEDPRTAMPTGNFTRYVLRFVHSGSYTHADVDWTSGPLSVDLEPGAWTVNLDAYAGTTVVSGTGSATVTVAAGVVTPITIAIGINTAAVQGTLTYEVNYPPPDANHAYGTQTLTVRDEGGAVIGTSATIANGVPGTLSLDPGVYFVSVVIADTTQRTGVTRTSVAHIYGNRDTPLEFTITPDEFTALVPVTVSTDLTIPGSGVTVDRRQVSAYSDASCTSYLGTATAAATNKTGPVDLILWVSSSLTTVYVRQEITTTVNAALTLAGPTTTVNITNPELPVTASRNDTAYKVDIATVITGGTVEVNTPAAFQDNTVTVTVTPESGSGYALKTLLYNPGGVTLAGPPPYTFTMPSSDVTMSAVFHKSIGITINDIQETTVLLSVDNSTISRSTNQVATFSLNNASYTVEDNNLKWLVNGTAITTATGGTLSINAVNYLPRTYYVTVMIKVNGQWYSKDLALIVTQ